MYSFTLNIRSERERVYACWHDWSRSNRIGKAIGEAKASKLIRNKKMWVHESIDGYIHIQSLAKNHPESRLHKHYKVACMRRIRSIKL